MATLLAFFFYSSLQMLLLEHSGRPPVTHQLASRGGLSHQQESTFGTILQSMDLRCKTDLPRGPRGLD